MINGGIGPRHNSVILSNIDVPPPNESTMNRLQQSVAEEIIAAAEESCRAALDVRISTRKIVV